MKLNKKNKEGIKKYLVGRRMKMVVEFGGIFDYVIDGGGILYTEARGNWLKENKKIWNKKIKWIEIRDKEVTLDLGDGKRIQGEMDLDYILSGIS